jgi:cob(I)alamin adenosyltransferase
MCGYVHVYTGDGKGKTTAAFGLALRAAGHGKRVYVGQFLKGEPSGEAAALADHPLVTVEQFGAAREPTGVAVPARRRVEQAVARATAALTGRQHDVVVLDELDVAVWCGLLTERQCLDLIDARPSHVELVITGRNAPAAVIARADLVTEMREVKHYFRRGVRARVGIEY